MRQAARITLFVHDRDGRLEAMPDLDALHTLLQQMPLISRNDDGSRTFVFDLVAPPGKPGHGESRLQAFSLESLRACSAALGQAARAMGLPLTAALADSAELVAEAEVTARHRAPRHFD
jgi:hypothetical protein